MKRRRLKTRAKQTTQTEQVEQFRIGQTVYLINDFSYEASISKLKKHLIDLETGKVEPRFRKDTVRSFIIVEDEEMLLGFGSGMNEFPFDYVHPAALTSSTYGSMVKRYIELINERIEFIIQFSEVAGRSYD